jgi:hypothetical protein
MLEKLVVLAGAGQLVLVAASTAIPWLLRWREQTAALRPLLRQVFWTYAGYILGTNLAFGLVSAFAPTWLLDRSPLAAAVTGFITLYWGARLALQLLWFVRDDVPPRPVYRAAHAALVALFAVLTGTYTAACFANLQR